MLHPTRIPAWVEGHRDVFFDLVRIYLGVGLFVKGVYFIANRQYLNELVYDLGSFWFVPAFVAHYVILGHLAGGLSLAIGLLTRWGALVQIPILVGAVFYVHLPAATSIDPRQNFEFSALVLFLLTLIWVRGGGPLSVDAYLESRDRVGEAALHADGAPARGTR